MESRCHLGRKRLYDTVTRYGWSVDVRTHRIGIIIDRLLVEDWDKPGEDGSPGREVPELTWDGEECDVGTSPFTPPSFISNRLPHKRPYPDTCTDFRTLTGGRMLLLGVWQIQELIRLAIAEA